MEAYGNPGSGNAYKGALGQHGRHSIILLQHYILTYSDD